MKKVWREVAAEVSRALRGPRSQLQWSRWLGYRSNVAADWEAGRRAPSASRFLDAVSRAGIDVPEAMARFDARAAEAWREGEVASWLSALRGTFARRTLAARMGASPAQVGRWSRGESEPRLPDLLAWVEATTGRVDAWLVELVDIRRVPSLLAYVDERKDVLALVRDDPWVAAVMTQLATLEAHEVDDVQRSVGVPLGLSEAHLRRLVQALEQIGALRWEGFRPRVLPLTIDVPSEPGSIERQRAHWGDISARRLHAPAAQDRFSFNAVAVSSEDFARIQELQIAYFREIRAIVSASKQLDVAGVITMHTFRW